VIAAGLTWAGISERSFFTGCAFGDDGLGTGNVMPSG
jgi:hypothetical protein